MDLGHNAFTGTIPNDWVEGNDVLVNLRVLYLDYNNFGGPLPQQWTSLGTGRMQSIVLSNNTFTGQVPGNYEVTNTLNIFDIEHNDFSSVDKDLCKLLVFDQGEISSLRLDCNVCGCQYFCDQGQCYNE